MSMYETRIAPVTCRVPSSATTEDKGEPVPLSENEKEICWLDQLCRGGIQIPIDLDSDSDGSRGRSVLLLLSGLSGTGKSTFALELCCRLVRIARESIEPNTFNALYVSAEESARRIIEKAESFGWTPRNTGGSDRLLFDFSKTADFTGVVPDSSVLVIGREQTPKGEDPTKVFGEMASMWKTKSTAIRDKFLGTPKPLNIVVVDSLNVISPLGDEAQRIKVFDAIQQQIADPKDRNNPSLIIVVLDAASGDGPSTYWEYVSDIVFRFGWELKRDYTLRTFEITKMRNQLHAWGKQRLKIYEGAQDGRYARLNESPCLKEGGIFVFPSIHWHLSMLRERRGIRASGIARPRSLRLPTAIDELNLQISGKVEYQGFPVAGCTAFVGRRGAMKSHLAYFFLLDQAKQGQNCVLISLRDNVSGACNTLAEIAESQGYANSNEGANFVEELIKSDRVEVLENEAGMISPEEFFHKVYVAVKRKRVARIAKSCDRPSLIVVINGLDQLESRFPLIAMEEMFVPALVQFLKAEDVCSVIIAPVDGSAGAVRNSLYGLLPMAELILRFDALDPKNPPQGYNWPSDFPPALTSVGSSTEQITRVETQRVPGGQIGGRLGYLYRAGGDALSYVRSP